RGSWRALHLKGIFCLEPAEAARNGIMLRRVSTKSSAFPSRLVQDGPRVPTRLPSGQLRMEHQEYKQETPSYSEPPATSRSARWAVPVAIALIGAAAFGVGYGLRQQSIVAQMTSRQNENGAQMAQMRTQIDTLNAKLSDALSSLQQRQQQP